MLRLPAVCEGTPPFRPNPLESSNRFSGGRRRLTNGSNHEASPRRRHRPDRPLGRRMRDPGTGRHRRRRRRGALIGSQFGGGPGERIAAGLAGAAIGGLIGNAIGRDLDAQDRRRAYEAERVVWVEGRRSEWRSEKAYGYVEPGRAYYRGATYCREYTHTIYVGGRPQTAVGTACRNPDGSWTPVG